MQLSRKKQKVGAASMAYCDYGQGTPLLMGHSFLWDADMWQPQIECLKGNYRCIAADLWSHGQSDPLPASSYSIETLANDYWQFAQSLSLQKYALIGLSVGGMWAAQMALNDPKSVSALVLMDTFVGSEPEITQKTYFGMMDQIERDKAISSFMADQVAPYFFARETAKDNPELVKHFVQNLMVIPSKDIQGIVTLGRAIFSRTSLLDKLAQIKVPTLIVVGEEDIPRPVHEAKEMAKLIPNAELAIIPKAGHICTLEQPQKVNEVLKTFLDKHLG